MRWPNILTWCEEDYFVGDLVCMKSYFGGSTGWHQVDVDVGIVLNVIEVEETFIYHDKKFRCYDMVVYWCKRGTTETVPDILLEHYEYFLRRMHEKK